jgi:uncharacterized damage-inducible protein DinB
MNETARLAALLRQACDGEPGRDDAWHGPSLKKVLQGVGAAQASRKPISGGHSIWELVLHIAVWDEICARRLEGEVIHATTGSPEDWPEVGETSEARWQEARARLLRAQAELARVVESLAEERLAEPVPGWDWPNHLMIHGTLHHDVYHAGQIALLKRGL